jgi:hypothetical protein
MFNNVKISYCFVFWLSESQVPITICLAAHHFSRDGPYLGTSICHCIKEFVPLLLLQAAGGNPTFPKVKTSARLQPAEIYEWVTMRTGQDAELKAEKMGKTQKRLKN